jgi:predicted glycosyltransferase
VRQRVLEELLRHNAVFVVELRSPIRDVADQDAATGDRHRIVESYPSSHFLNGFDFAVSGAGYNSFHENLMAGLPTLFVPNEAEEMDLQLSRARFAEISGYARLLRRQDIHSMPEAIGAMMDAAERQLMRERCAELPPITGAAEAARFITESLRFVRTDFDIADADFRASSA